MASSHNATVRNAMKIDNATLNLRLDLLRMMMTELARALPTSEAARAADAIGRCVADRMADSPISQDADESIAADLAPILAALRNRSTSPYLARQVPHKTHSVCDSLEP